MASVLHPLRAPRLIPGLILALLLSLLPGRPGKAVAADRESEAIVFLPLDRLSGYSSHDWLRTALPEVVAAKLTGAVGLRVLESRAVAEKLRGTAGSVPDQLSPAIILPAARAAGADLVVWGEFDKHAENLSIHLNVTRVADGTLLGEVRQTGGFEEPWTLLSSVARATLKVTGHAPGTNQENRLSARAARDRYTLTLFGRGLNQVYGVAGPVELEAGGENLERAQRIDPTNPLLWYAVGMLHLVKGEPDGAGAAFYEALKGWPDYPNVHRHMASLAEGEQRYDEAVLHLQQVLMIEPGDLRARYDLGRVLAILEKVRPALDEIARVVEGPAPSELKLPALKLQAQLRSADGDLTGMAASFRRILEIEPDSREARLGLGAFFLRRGALVEAEEQFRFLATKDPRDPLPPHYLGEIAILRGDMEGAVSAFRQEGGIRPSHWSAWSYLGEVYRRAGRLNKVVDAEGMAQVRAPRNPVPLNNLAIARFHEGDYATAALLMRQAIALSPGWGLLHQNLGIVQAAQGQRSKAIPTLRTAVALSPQLPAGQYQLGLLLAQSGDLAGARAAFEAAVAADRRLAAGYFNLAGVLEALGEKAAAVKALEAYLELSPKGGDADQVKSRIARLK